MPTLPHVTPQTRLPNRPDAVALFVMNEQVNKDLARDAIQVQHRTCPIKFGRHQRNTLKPRLPPRFNQAKLSRSVLDNYNTFIQGMKHVQDVDLTIARAGVHVSNALRKLAQARHSLVYISCPHFACHAHYAPRVRQRCTLAAPALLDLFPLVPAIALFAPCGAASSPARAPSQCPASHLLAAASVPGGASHSR